jgi:amidase
MRLPPERRGRLYGLPVPIKDLTAVEGVRTTHGSTIHATNVPTASDVLVEHLERQGAVVYAKSNTPEFGAGANTFNDVFGRTLNPWNVGRSAAGSSGGAAVALATGMAWLAHGSDMGGSLRNPASFCGVVGMRPSPGRVARSRTAALGGMLSVEGPMARDVEDVALLLDAMSGADRRDPSSLPTDGASFLAAARGGPLPRRVAFSRDLGITPVEPEVGAMVEAAAQKLAAAGIIVEEAHPDLSEAHDCFQVLRALSFATGLKDLLASHGERLKPEIVWNIEKGLKLTVEEIVKAEQQRVAMFDRTIAFFETYDLLLAPATITAAFPVEQRYLAECNGHRFGNYVEWLAIAYAITIVACPAISIPAGFNKEELPVGLQIVGPPQGEARVLRGAKLMQDILDLGPITPIDPRAG